MFLKNGFVGRYEFYDVLARKEKCWLSASQLRLDMDAKTCSKPYHPHHAGDHVSRIESKHALKPAPSTRSLKD